MPYNDILTYEDLLDKDETKRKWANGKNMAIWGKKRSIEDNDDDVLEEMKRKWKSDNMAVWGKRKWSTGNNMAVWGKRHADDDEEKRNWKSNKNMALWGKRDIKEREEFEGEEKRKWAGKDMAVWG